MRRARDGRAALFLKPFMTVKTAPKLPPYRAPRGTPIAARRAGQAAHAAAAAAAKAADTLAAAARERATHRDTDCNLCGAPRGDVVHICTVCPATATRRDAALGGGRFAALLHAIVDALVALHGQPRAPAYLTDAVDALDPASPEAVFIITRIVTSSPWREADALPGWTIVPRLGALLDRTVRRSSAARLSDAWVTAAHTIISKVGLRWWQLLTPPARAALEAAGHRFPA